ncbi:transposase family protein [Streptomyces sp. NPDC001982]|uniref:transposase family protein n=1 Tax=Streptomyces sp. NPDC001982 TaxID=3154405 RepID=UPI0033247F2C
MDLGGETGALQRDHHRPSQQDHQSPAGAGLGALADLGFVGLDDDPDDPVIVTGRRATRGHPLTAAQKEANRLVSRERAANEHGFADLKNWRILTKVRMNARQATKLLRALLVLTNGEVHR